MTAPTSEAPPEPLPAIGEQEPLPPAPGLGQSWADVVAAEPTEPQALAVSL